jgi:hypothetical protein
MIRELLIQVSTTVAAFGEDGSPHRVDVFVVTDDAPRAIGTLLLFEREIALARAVVDSLLPQLMPQLVVYWKDAPAAADDALGAGVLKRIGQLAKFARTLKLLPS